MGEGFCSWCNRIRAVDERQIGTTQHTGPECPVCKDLLMSASRKKAVEPLATRWISKKQVARLLDISVSTVERNVKRGILPDPTYKLGSRAPRWNEDDINILMELDG